MSKDSDGQSKHSGSEQPPIDSTPFVSEKKTARALKAQSILYKIKHHFQALIFNIYRINTNRIK
jgi:hypothetical protein